MTQKIKAQDGVLTPQMSKILQEEEVTEEALLERVAAGRIVIPCNVNHQPAQPKGIGEGLTVKINCNLGASEDRCDIDLELSKLDIALQAGTDTVMDLSTGGDIDLMRREILARCPVPLGTVPIYQACVGLLRSGKTIADMSVDHLFEVIEQHADDGVDFITVHCGVTRRALERLRSEGRVMNIVSRGGAFLANWMLCNNKENPLYEHFDRLLDICRRYDVTLSLGDGLRPGCIADASDRCQFEEHLTLGELTERAWDAGVQVMIEGPGHVPLHQIEANMVMEKRICHGAPFYVLGPLVTDIAPGYDHITAAIGGALAAWYGADFLCYVTPAEHLRLPDLDDVKEGVIASKIAAHAADIARGNKAAWQRDLQMSQARRNLDWKKQIELSLDPEKARRMRSQTALKDEKVCSMCSQYCAIDIVNQSFDCRAFKPRGRKIKKEKG